MIRELVLVSADLTGTPWFARGTPPAPPIPAGISIETVSDSTASKLFAAGPVAPAEAASRLAEGDTCHVAVTTAGVMVAEMWCTERPRFIDWIGCDVRPPDGHVHVYNSWVEPEYRGLGLQWNLASVSCRDVADRGRGSMCAGVERREYPPFARKYAAMGLGVMAPYTCIWSLRLLGVTVDAVPSRPPRCLESAARNARKIYARRAERV